MSHADVPLKLGLRPTFLVTINELLELNTRTLDKALSLRGNKTKKNLAHINPSNCERWCLNCPPGY